jgi:hypothetical protein
VRRPLPAANRTATALPTEALPVPLRRPPFVQIWLSDQELLSLIKAGHKVVESYGL